MGHKLGVHGRESQNLGQQAKNKVKQNVCRAWQPVVSNCSPATVQQRKNVTIGSTPERGWVAKRLVRQKYGNVRGAPRAYNVLYPHEIEQRADSNDWQGITMVQETRKLVE